jgi:internalin A
MAIRIYSLAKDLGTDSKELVELCAKLGIQGKGSALASMEDQEIAKIKEYLKRADESFEDHIKKNGTRIRWRGRGLSILPDSLTSLSSLVELDIAANKVGLSNESVQRISELVSLKSLDLSSNSIVSIPEDFGKLVNLESLDLSGNSISDLPRSFANLKSLKTLRLDGNNFSDIPTAISELHQLVLLDLSINKLASIPDWFGEQSSIARLYLSVNKLETLPSAICALSNLKELRVDENQLTELPNELGRMRSLSILSANRNRISTIPNTINQCEFLEELELASNCVEKLPSEFGSLVRLRILRMSDNKITALPDSIGSLSSLTVLDLSNNRLEWLPIQILRLVEQGGLLKLLYLHENLALRIPPEILGPNPLDAVALSEQITYLQNARSVLRFYFKRQSGRIRKLREAKLILVGQGGVGKTSLARILLNPDAVLNRQEGQTDGIAIMNWSVSETQLVVAPNPNNPANSRKMTKRQRKKQKRLIRQSKKAIDQHLRGLRNLPPVRVNVWDFGGQEIMHSTHQFFLTERSLYLLVLDARSGEYEGNLHGWLKTIQGFGGPSPVLIVVNKCEPPHHMDLDETRLRIDYSPNLVGVHYVSCENGTGLDELRAAVQRQILGLPHINDELPESYFEVKSELKRRAEIEDFVTQEQYRVVCKKYQVFDDDSQRILLQFLHDLGSVLHYDDPRQHYLVYDTNVLNPEWVTNGVYKILMNHELRANGDGKVREADLEKLLGDPVRYPRERHRFLVDLMRKFDLCFALSEDSGQLLVPELLSPNEPDIGWDMGEFLNFQFHYTVLPRGLMPRFIVRTHHLLTKNRTYWRSGVVLEIEGCRVAVRGDARAAIVYVQVQGGNAAKRRRALAIVRDHFGAIHSSMPRLDVQAKIPLPGEEKAPPVDFEHLCRLEQLGQDLQLFERAQKQCSVRELLDGVIEREFDVFLCHNSLDKPIVRELSRRLRERGVRSWLDETGLTAGKPWQAEIVESIAYCRTVAVLIGPAGAGIWQLEEIRLALSEAASLKKRVIPVILPPGELQIDVNLPAEFRYLSQRTWVKFGNDLDEDNISKLCKGIRS